MIKLNKFNKRLFWNLILFLPKWIREKIVRSRFKVNYQSDFEFIFKQATTKNEIEQALNLVYDSYVHLNYIDKNPDQLHLPKYLTLPTTAIMVIKRKEEVVGTLSIILDSALGLPTETTWDIRECKGNGKNIAEISALTIKKEMRNLKGQLLLPLFKLIYLFSQDLLNVNGLVIATTFEVEPFYTDLILFKKIPDSRGQGHDLVKGNKSSCCFLELNDSAYWKYQRVYSHKNRKYDLHHYFFECETANIQLPVKMLSVQAQLKEKNLAMLELINEKPHLFSRFSDNDKLIISNLDPGQQLVPLCLDTRSNRKNPRLVTMINGRIEKKGLNISTPSKIVEVSQNGLKIKLLNQDDIPLNVNDEISIKIERHLSSSTFVATVIWVDQNKVLGCLIQEKSVHHWKNFYQTAWEEVQEIAHEMPWRERA